MEYITKMEDIINAVKAGDIQIIKNKLKLLPEFSSEILEVLLENSPSQSVSDIINEAFRLHEINESDSSCSDKENNEEKVFRKYSKNDPKLDKAAKMFFAALKNNIKKVKYDKAYALCFEITEIIYSMGKASFPKEVRTKVHNLKENIKLCERIYRGDVIPAEFVEMTSEDMKTETMKANDEKAFQDGILSAQVAKPVEETDMFQCSKCHERKCSYYQLQTRSCDEPMTTFVTCTVCGNRWRF